MSVISRFYGPNAGYVLELYDRYRQDPASVDPETRALFEHWTPEAPQPLSNGFAAGATAMPAVDVAKIVGLTRLAESIRERGHRAAHTDPLGSEPAGDPSLLASDHGLSREDLEQLPASIVGGPAAEGAPNAAVAIDRLREIYCGVIGYDFAQVQSSEQRDWLTEAVESGRYRTPLSAEAKRALLQQLTDVEAFERFLGRAFVGRKRFSIEGTDMAVPMIQAMVEAAGEAGTKDIIIGMAHRGRLNVLAHIMGKPYAKFFAEFMGLDHGGVDLDGDGDIAGDGWTGDVKYHLGAYRPAGELPANITMACNPSHLEFVDPVVAGMTRAQQEKRDQPGKPPQDTDSCLAILLHGDAAFPGEGIVAESLSLIRLPDYDVGGTLRIIVNNQLGFTAEPWQSRSTRYASDLARGYEIPVVHVDADDPEACLAMTRMAYDFRQTFHEDFLIDMIGYRRWGHNEGEEPAFTQPQMYEIVRKHPTVREIWANTLDQQGVMPKAESDAMLQAVMNHLQEIRQAVADGDVPHEETKISNLSLNGHHPETAVALETLRRLNREVYTLPADFHMHPKLQRQMQRRIDALENDTPLEWGHAETLAFASIIADGTPIRMAGQDAEPGTFSQRHLVFHDIENGDRYTPLQHIPSAKASFAIADSPLNEGAAMGFEFGYNIQAPEAMVIWEAQYGDFANAGQVMIDQYIVAARAKWQLEPSLVMLLPQGYEGPEPEHSSGRLERFLQLAASDNIRLANCSTATQYFHLLRDQAAALHSKPRPLVIFTPKKLLRHAASAAPPEALANGWFQPVIDDAAVENKDAIGRLILCTGKIWVDMTTSEQYSSGDLAKQVALVRVEQLYPFPEEQVRQIVSSYPNATEVVWVQEEPRNMGAWHFVERRLRQYLHEGQVLRYIGRPRWSSPAEGFQSMYTFIQAHLIEEAFADIPQVGARTFGVKQHAD